MFVAHYERTMKSAKFQAPKERPLTVNIVEIRRRKLADARVAITKRLAASEEHLQRQRALATAAIRVANRSLARAYGVLSFERIVSRICRATGVRELDVFSSRRSRDFVFARHAIMYWACRRTVHSLPEIGRLLGGLDHTSILNGRKKYPKKRAKMGRYLRALDRREATS